MTFLKISLTTHIGFMGRLKDKDVWNAFELFKPEPGKTVFSAFDSV